MTAHHKPAAPIIAAGMGHELPDLYAGKVVNRWLDHIHADEMTNQASTASILAQSRGIGGSPVAQKKFAARIVKGMGDNLLFHSIITGKRANFSIAWDVLHAGGALIERATDWDDTVEPPRWVYIMRNLLRKAGPQSELQHRHFPIAAISHHALTRIVQRAGVERYADVVKMMHSAWRSLCLVELATRPAREDGDTTAYLVPMRMATGGSDIGAFVITPNSGAGLKLTPVARTFLSGAMMGDRQYSACVELLDMIEQLAPAEMKDAHFEELLPLIMDASSQGGALNHLD
jgi:hypothetical protein